MTSRLKIKVGLIEVEYEGEEKFIKDELPGLIKAVAELHERAGPTLEAEPVSDSKGHVQPSKKGAISTSAIATKLSCKTGSDLALAAAAHLALIEGKEHFSRADIVKAMKSASAFFKKNYISNLTSALKSLVTGDKLNQIGAESYALTASETKRISTTLGL